MIISGEEPPALPGLPGYEPDISTAGVRAEAMRLAMAALRKVVESSGSYPAESSYFEPDWANVYWGDHYPRLRAIKARYDPEGLFVTHHDVGSERWSPDGFSRVR